MVQEWYYEEEDRPQYCIDMFSRICMLGQNQLRISSRGFTTVTAMSLQPRQLVKGITASSATTSVVPSKHTMIKAMSSGRQTMTSMVISVTSTAAGSSFLSASQVSMRMMRLGCITTGSAIMTQGQVTISAKTR